VDKTIRRSIFNLVQIQIYEKEPSFNFLTEVYIGSANILAFSWFK